MVATLKKAFFFLFFFLDKYNILDIEMSNTSVLGAVLVWYSFKEVIRSTK